MTLTLEKCQRAADAWGFNCGPAALCAVLGKSPDDVRPLLGDFEAKGYTNPTLMYAALKLAGVTARTTYRGDVPRAFPDVTHGLVRVQWGGSWTNPGVPMGARYRRTHWVAMRTGREVLGAFAVPKRLGREVFDVNAMCVGGWLEFAEWETQMMPWLGGAVVPGWDGRIWPTHVIEVAA